MHENVFMKDVPSKRLTRVLSRVLTTLMLLSVGLNCAKFAPDNGLLGILMWDNLFGWYGNALQVQESSSTTAVTEGGTTDSYGLFLKTRPLKDVPVQISFDTAQLILNGSSVSPQTVTFTKSNWNTPQIISVQAFNDGIFENLQISTVTHTPTLTDFQSDPSSRAVNVTITDDDMGSIIVTESGGSTAITEGTVTGESYNIRLPRLPTAPVNVSVIFDTTQVTVNGSSVSPQIVILDGSNWSTGLNVTVEAWNDTLDEDNHTSTLTHSLASADVLYNLGAVPQTVVAAITDNDWLVAGGCTNKRRLTINNATIGTGLTNFPVLVKLNATRVTYGSTSNTDIRFYDMASNVLNHEIENWNAAGNSFLWVKVPSITASTNTEYIWMYYNCVGAATYNPTGVWSNGYSAVHHFDTITGLTDSTGNGFNGTNSGSSNVIGFLGYAQDYVAASTNSISFPNSGISVGTGGDGTILAWTRPDSGLGGGDHGFIFSHRANGSTDNRVYLRMYDNNEEFWIGIGDRGTGGGVDTSATFNVGTWAMVTITWWDLGSGNGRSQGYFNNNRVTSGNPVSYQTDNTASPLTLGCYSENGICTNVPSYGSPGYWDGLIDEFRVSSVARSTNWIRAQYMSMTDAYLGFGPEL